MPTRRFLLVVALVVAACLVTSGLVAGLVAARNRATIADAQTTGLDTAGAAAELSTRVAANDSRAATMLLVGGVDPSGARAGYDAELLDDARPLAAYDPELALAARALADAGLAGTDEDRDDLRALNDDLVRYAALVEAARANTRQGYPVGAAYLNQARTIAEEDVIPTAHHLRRESERRVAQAANDVGGPAGAAAVAFMALALLVLGGAVLLVAGRTRRLMHPALLLATILSAVVLVLMVSSILWQSRDLRAAATTDIRAYVGANDAAAALSGLRVTEIEAVAAHGGGARSYEEFRTQASSLADRLANDPVMSDLHDAVVAYAQSVERVEELDMEGDNEGATRRTLRGGSAVSFTAADAAASRTVVLARAKLEDRFDAVAEAGVPPLLPVALGLGSGYLALAGTLARRRPYQ